MISVFACNCSALFLPLNGLFLVGWLGFGVCAACGWVFGFVRAHPSQRREGWGTPIVLVLRHLCLCELVGGILGD
jgi:hypothetical protein